MLNQTRLNTEPTPGAIVPQAVKTPPPQPASADTRDTVSTVQSNGDRTRSKNNGTVPPPSIEPATVKPVAGPATNHDARKVRSSLMPPTSTSEPASGETLSDSDRLDQTSDPRTEETIVPDDPGAKNEREARLVEEIVRLWSSHKKTTSYVKKNREVLNRARNLTCQASARLQGAAR